MTPNDIPPLIMAYCAECEVYAEVENIGVGDFEEAEDGRLSLVPTDYDLGCGHALTAVEGVESDTDSDNAGETA